MNASIGVRNVLAEWSPLSDHGAGLSAILLGLLLAALGFHAVVALVLM